MSEADANIALRVSNPRSLAACATFDIRWGVPKKPELTNCTTFADIPMSRAMTVATRSIDAADDSI